jgi:CRP-like cAMP-binding protein
MKPSPSLSCEPRHNQLLADLPDEDLARWASALEPVTLCLGQVLCESGSTAAYVYFPTTAIVSLLYLTQDGESTEIAVVGRDGMVGISLFMGGNGTPSRSVVQSAGEGLRLPAHLVKQEIKCAGAIQAMLLRYTQSLMAQVAQTAACNRYHSIDQLLCRRLLMGLDRLPSEAMMMTQELLANLLGVRREGVTAAALKLSQAGLISYSRGRIAVLDRARLEQRLGSPTLLVKQSRGTPVPLAA